MNARLKEGSKLPEGLTLNANGEITGTPTKAGIYVFTIVANADGKVGDELTLTLYVAYPEQKNSGIMGKTIGYIPSKDKDEL